MNPNGARRKYGNSLIAQFILETGMTDEQFATFANTPVRSVQSWRRGDCEVTLKKYKELRSKYAEIAPNR